MKILFSPNPTQEKILFTLAKYKFLTTSQLLRLEVSSTKSNLSRAFRDLKIRKLIAAEGFAQPVRTDNKYRYRKLENFYYLTKKGAEIVKERLNVEDTRIKYPRGRSTFFSQNYWHHKYIIDCEIEAHYWSKSKGYEVIVSDRDFDKVGSNRRARGFARTRIECGPDKYIVPDANFVLFNNTDYKLFTLELHHQKNTKSIVNQLTKHILALKNGGVGLLYNINKLHRVLNVFVEEAKMNVVIKNLGEMESFKELEEFFLFKHLGQILKKNAYKSSDHQGNNICDFYEEWLTFKGQKVEIL